MRHIVRATEAVEIVRPGLRISAYSPEDGVASASKIAVDGEHHRIRSTHSDRIYLVQSGSGWFEIDGVTTRVGVDDVIFLPRETGYSYGGKMEVFLVHAPGFLEGTDVELPPIDGV
jgi:mannose-6-phosphate isomerase-like protein (cupin superfamily)